MMLQIATSSQPPHPASRRKQNRWGTSGDCGGLLIEASRRHAIEPSKVRIQNDSLLADDSKQRQRDREMRMLHHLYLTEWGSKKFPKRKAPHPYRPER